MNTIIELTGLPKVSLNKWYAGEHWSKRDDMKNNYIWIVKSQFSEVLKNDVRYTASYTFFFKNKPLDASNCVGMLKMIEDIIFEDDKWNQIDIGSIKSRKGEKDKVIIEVSENFEDLI